jgi:hypothetical protein
VRAFADQEIEELLSQLLRSRRLTPVDLVVWNCLISFGLRPAELQELGMVMTPALNLLRLAGFRSIRAGIQAVMYDITALLAMARRHPQPDPC